MRYFPTVDTAVLLGSLRVEDGDAIITPEGREFAHADIQARKAIFRKAALANVPPAPPDGAGSQSQGGSYPSRRIFPRSPRRTSFSEDESRRQLETAIQWGRYAELFDYDASTGKLTLTEA